MSTIEIYLQQERSIDPQAVHALYRSMGWWPERTVEQIASVLKRDVAIGAWDGERLVGFARVVSDHCFHAYVDDVMTHPTYQHQGIGRRLLAHLVEALPHIETITLFCESELVHFYEELGFRAFPEQRVMHRKHTTPS
jgi:GNAT superfamily N-acetyltransferase